MEIIGNSNNRKWERIQAEGKEETHPFSSPKKVAQAAISEMQTTGFPLLNREEKKVKKKKGRKSQRQNGGSLAAKSACVMPGHLSRAAESVSKH